MVIALVTLEQIYVFSPATIKLKELSVINVNLDILGIQSMVPLAYVSCV